MQKGPLSNSFLIYVGIALALLLLAPYFGLHIITSRPTVETSTTQGSSDEPSDSEQSQVDKTSSAKSPDTFDDIENLLKK